MKRKAHASKSTYRAILSVQKSRDQPSGLSVSNRFFQPESATKAHPLVWFAVDVLLLDCLAGGLLLLFISGFSVPVSRMFLPAALVLCMGITASCRSRWSQRHWLIVWTVFLLLYLLVLFFCQDSFFKGAMQFGCLIVDTLNRTYQAEQASLADVSGTDSAALFLMLAAIPVIMWLAVSLFQRNSLLMCNLLLFPVLVLLALCGAARNTAALFLVLLGILLCMAYSKPKRQRRMWGGENLQLQKQNQRRFQSIQKKNAFWTLVVFLFFSVPGFLVVRPLLSVSLKPAQQISLELQGSFLTKVMKLLPELSAGEWNLNVEAVGGGVQDGVLGSNEGYLLEGVEDLKLTLSTKPKEAIFLKGYIGTTYENGRWENPYGTTFDGAAINWNTEGSPRLYIQNLPFLRTAFALTQAHSEQSAVASAMSAFLLEPAQMLVERRNANDDYTYLPYGAYLNDYYQINAGDGAVAGQSEQEDRFFFFFREDLEEVLSAWNALDGTDNVLDRIEESYRAFCETNKSSPNFGMDALQEEIDGVIAENHWNEESNLDEITAWIRHYLAENYQYQLIPEAVPDGKDALDYFLFESKSGNSVHFASAAVVLYRMFGIPARYVVGYEIPAALFSVQANGTYTATVQGDNAQAWAEIYVPGIGWMPRDMTPGVIGTYEEVGPGGEKIEAFIEETDASDAEKNLIQEQTSPDDPTVLPETAQSDRLHIREYSLEQTVKGMAYLALSVLLAAGFILFGKRFCRALGFDPFRRFTVQQRMVFVFQALYARMCRLGLPENANSQSEEFLSFCETQLSRRCPETVCLLRPAMEKLYHSCFGAEKVTRANLILMRKLLLASYHRSIQPERNLSEAGK